MLAPVLLWAVAVSIFAYQKTQETERLVADQALQKAAYDDKVRALTRRLVGVASHQALEQDGLAGRMADLVTRQVDLETRSTVLASYANRLTDPSRPSAVSAPASRAARPQIETDAARDAYGASRTAESPGRSTPPETNVLRLGGPRPPEPAAPVPRPHSSVESSESDPASEGGAARSDRIGALVGLPVRAQFEALESSLDKVETLQTGALAAIAQVVRNGIGRIRTAVGTLGIAAPSPSSSVAMAAARPGALRNSFDNAAQGLDAGFDELRRWRAFADTVPLRRPLEAAAQNLTSNFGMRKDPFTGAAQMHAGMDFRAPVGTSVLATAAGRVITASVTGGYGNLVEVDHGNGVVTRYGHLSAYAVAVGQAVQADTVLGKVGSTGRSTGPHLHYETRISGNAVDPMRFLKAGTDLYGDTPGADDPNARPAGEDTSED